MQIVTHSITKRLINQPHCVQCLPILLPILMFGANNSSFDCMCSLLHEFKQTFTDCDPFLPGTYVEYLYG